jgi:hypothetical protein
VNDKEALNAYSFASYRWATLAPEGVYVTHGVPGYDRRPYLLFYPYEGTYLPPRRTGWKVGWGALPRIVMRDLGFWREISGNTPASSQLPRDALYDHPRQSVRSIILCWMFGQTVAVADLIFKPHELNLKAMDLRTEEVFWTRITGDDVLHIWQDVAQDPQTAFAALMVGTTPR